jgi:hypothetical protein
MEQTTLPLDSPTHLTVSFFLHSSSPFYFALFLTVNFEIAKNVHFFFFFFFFLLTIAISIEQQIAKRPLQDD